MRFRAEITFLPFARREIVKRPTKKYVRLAHIPHFSHIQIPLSGLIPIERMSETNSRSRKAEERSDTFFKKFQLISRISS